MDSMPHKLDGRSLYVLLKLADFVVEKLDMYGNHEKDSLVPLNVVVAITGNRVQELKSAVQNARYVLEHVTFEVQPPHQQTVENHTRGMHVSAPERLRG